VTLKSTLLVWVGRWVLIFRNLEHVEKFDFVESTKSCKFNGKLCTFGVQIVWICKKIKLVESTN